MTSSARAVSGVDQLDLLLPVFPITTLDLSGKMRIVLSKVNITGAVQSCFLNRSSF